MNAHDEDDRIVPEAFRILRRTDTRQAGEFRDLMTRTGGTGRTEASRRAIWKRRLLSRRGLGLALVSVGAFSALALVGHQLMVRGVASPPHPPGGSLAKTIAIPDPSPLPSKPGFLASPGAGEPVLRSLAVPAEPADRGLTPVWGAFDGTVAGSATGSATGSAAGTAAGTAARALAGAGSAAGLFAADAAAGRGAGTVPVTCCAAGRGAGTVPVTGYPAGTIGGGMSAGTVVDTGWAASTVVGTAVGTGSAAGTVAGTPASAVAAGAAIGTVAGTGSAAGTLAGGSAASTFAYGAVAGNSAGLAWTFGGLSRDEGGESKTVFCDTFVEDLPILGRNYQSLLTLAPGINASNGDGNPNVHGAREHDFKAIVDGVSNVDPLSGTLVSNVHGDTIESVAVVTTGASAEYGGAVGGFSTISTAQSRARRTKAGRIAGKGRAGTADATDAAGANANTESYAPIDENPLLSAVQNPLSTFSIDVDTASYTNVRRYLDQGSLPPKSAVRIEELINYFPYDYPPPPAGDAFSVNVEVADCPWNPEHRLARIGLKAADVSRKALAGSNLVFLIDVSGSMAEPAKLPLVKSALALLVGQLDASDRIAIVVYAGASGLVLPPTRGDDKVRMMEALDRLAAGGSTNGGEGLALAYRIAREGFVTGGINRVILATDGDFNVGMTDRGELLAAIKRDADAGIFLTALGFGMGNYKDDTLELLADKGNGNYAYIDNQAEARKVLVEQVGGTLVTVAKDVKIQVEFNPARVGAYRLLGYENRLMAKEHFNDDTKDGGEIGSGHTVTALYEIVPPAPSAAPAKPAASGASEPAGADLSPVDPLKYQTPAALSEAAGGDELLTVKLRYKEPEGSKSRLILHPVLDPGAGTPPASDELRFASAVAMFGMLLRESPNCGAASLGLVEKLASHGRGRDEGGYRTDFLRLVQRAASLRGGGGAPIEAGEAGR